MNNKASSVSFASKHIPYTHLNEPTVFESRNGEVGSIIAFKGVPFDTADDVDLNRYKRQWHHALCQLGDEFAVTVHTCRKKVDVLLQGEFSDPFTQSVDTRYHERFKNTSLYHNEWTATVIYKGMTGGKATRSIRLFQALNHQIIAEAKASYREQSIATLKKAVNQLIANMSEFSPHLLGYNDKSYGHSEVMSFLFKLINAQLSFKLNIPTFPVNVLTAMEQPVVKRYFAKYPKGNLAHALAGSRLYFGDYIAFEQAGRTCFGAIISIKEYGADTSPLLFDKLLRFDCEFIETNSFAIESNEITQQKILKAWIRMENSNDAAHSQRDALAGCQDEIASSQLRLGYHHHSLMLIADNLSHLKLMINKAIKAYSDVGFVAMEERLGLEVAFWAQLPCNQRYIVRSGLITSQNFVDCCSLHQYPTGYRDRNHLGSAVTLIETAAKTPLFFNFHSQGSGKRDDFTPGHTTVIGGNGSGKTVFLGFMDSQISRYHGRSFFFDRNRGMEIYIRAAGGSYSVIHPDYPVSFNPFSLPDTPGNRSFLKVWLGELIKEEGELSLSSDIEAMVAGAIDYAYDALLTEHRQLSTVIQFFPMDFPRRERLKKWLKQSTGDYAFLFDNATDTLVLNQQKIGFDMTWLMNQPKAVLTAVCLYLVHQIECSLDGQLVGIYFDEGWQILNNPYWKSYLEKTLPTLRKMNAYIVLSTQSPQSVIESSLSAQFLDNCATTIFFCNEKADFDKHYRYFNIMESEFQFIKETPRSERLFLYKQGHDSAIATLNLSGLDDALAVYSANQKSLQLLDRIRAEVGDDPTVWLLLFHERRKMHD